ncbi:MAG: hypothetical protein ACREUS_14135, partial [Burkholderiales bacterium]
AGQSAAPILDEMTGGGAAAHAVQRDDDDDVSHAPVLELSQDTIGFEPTPVGKSSKPKYLTITNKDANETIEIEDIKDFWLSYRFSGWIRGAA